MSRARPKFMDSEWFYEDITGWHLKEGAPEDIVEEFNAFMEDDLDGPDC